MNPRLTEIYRSCRSQEGLASQDEYKSANVLLGSEVERFAELIVRECCNIANKQFNGATGLDDRDSWTAVEIKQHFGVE